LKLFFTVNILLYVKITATIIPYIPKIPAITTGIIDFIIKSGFNTPIDDIPTPALAVPIAAPKFAKTNANDTPIYPKNASGPV